MKAVQSSQELSSINWIGASVLRWAERQRDCLLAVVSSAFLSVLFLVLYGQTNEVASQQLDVATVRYAWENSVPFIPFMILPYMSLDLFFVSSPFLCRNSEERQLLLKRITFTILFSATIFLAFPLKCTFEKPQVSGVLGWIFNTFLAMDKPFNQFPSLHVSLGVLLALHFGQHSRGLLRWIIYIWFALIIASTEFTYQHHFIDIVGGFGMAAFILAIFRSGKAAARPSHHFRLGSLYAAGALVTVAMVLRFWGWSWILLWPIISLSLTAAAYWGAGTRIYGKHRGRVHPISKLLLAPVLLGHRISLLFYSFFQAPWNKLTSRVWIGRRLSRTESLQVLNQGVTAVLDLTGEFDEAAALLEVSYLNLPVMDLTAPGSGQVERAIEFINQYSKTGVVYVHCKIGYSRTAAIVGAWLLATGQAQTSDQAILALKQARPGIVIRPEAEAIIRQWERRPS